MELSWSSVGAELELSCSSVGIGWNLLELVGICWSYLKLMNFDNIKDNINNIRMTGEQHLAPYQTRAALTLTKKQTALYLSTQNHTVITRVTESFYWPEIIAKPMR